jgi:RHS repeat-associated protein
VTEGMATSWGFTGRRHDSSTEMYYRARYLDAEMGTFVHPDPVRTLVLASQDEQLLHAVGLNALDVLPAYAYAVNSPVTRTDALGLFSPRVHSDLTEGILLAWQWAPLFAQLARVCNVDQDRLTNQQNNYQHGMSDPGESRYNAYQRWHRYVFEQLALAQNHLNCGKRGWAACELGRGLHAVQDRWAHNFITLGGHANPAYLIADFTPSYDDLIFADLESWEYVERFMTSDSLSSGAMGQGGAP